MPPICELWSKTFAVVLAGGTKLQPKRVSRDLEGGRGAMMRDGMHGSRGENEVLLSVANGTSRLWGLSPILFDADFQSHFLLPSCRVTFIMFPCHSHLNRLLLDTVMNSSQTPLSLLF
jgi:hypothetical protein